LIEAINSQNNSQLVVLSLYYIKICSLPLPQNIGFFQLLQVITSFFHCPGKNTFCHGKIPTLKPPVN